MRNSQAQNDHPRQAARRLDFEVRVSGRVVDSEWHVTRPPRRVCGVVTSLYPQALDIVGIRTDDGEHLDVRVSR